MRAINLATKLLLELAALAALAWWGASTGSGAVPVLRAIAAPTAMIVLWGRYAAPRAAHRLPLAARVPFELGVFAVAALSLIAAGHAAPAIAFAAVVVLNAALLTMFDQWEA